MAQTHYKTNWVRHFLTLLFITISVALILAQLYLNTATYLRQHRPASGNVPRLQISSPERNEH